MMSKIDDILNEVESGKTDPKKAANSIESDLEARFCCGGMGHKKHHGGIFFGLYLVLQGITWLFYHLGYFPSAGSVWNIIWPVIIGVIGIQMIWSMAKRRNVSLLGIILLSIGIARMVVNASVITMAQWWGWFWPISIILLGVALLLRPWKTGGWEFRWHDDD